MKRGEKRKKGGKKSLIMNLVQRESNHVESRSSNLIYAEDGTLFHTQKRECAANESILKNELKGI